MNPTILFIIACIFIPIGFLFFLGGAVRVMVDIFMVGWRFVDWLLKHYE